MNESSESRPVSLADSRPVNRGVVSGDCMLSMLATARVGIYTAVLLSRHRPLLVAFIALPLLHVGVREEGSALKLEELDEEEANDFFVSCSLLKLDNRVR